MSTGRLNNPLYDERGQFIGNQQPEANMFYGFNPTGAIGTGVSSGIIPAVANPLDDRPAGGGKGGGKGGGFAPPPPPNMYGGAGYNTIMGAGGIRPTSTPAFTSGFTSPAMTPPQGKGGGMQGKGGGMPPPAPASGGKGGGKGGGMPPSPPAVSRIAEDAVNLSKAFGGPSGPPAPAGGGTTPSPKGGGKGGEIPDYMKEAAGRIGQPRTPPPSDMQAPPAGGGLFGGLANAANLVNQQRRRDDFINSDNELNRIRAEQMALERKARQEAINRSYYDQPAEPTVAQQPANIAEPAQPPLQFGDPGYMPTYNPSMPAAPTMLPASRDPFVRRMRTQQDALNDAYRRRLNAMGSFDPSGIQASQLKFLEEMRRGTPQETPQQREERLISYISTPADRFGPVDSKLDAEYDNFLRTRRQPLLGAGLGALAMGGNPFMR